MHTARTSIAAAFLSLGLLASACSQSEVDRDAKAEPDTPSTSASTRPPQATDPATNSSPAPPGGAVTVPASLDFTATTVSGSDFAGADVAGKPVVLWFWAPWCPVCRGQGDDVVALAEQYAGDVNVVGIGSLDSGDAIAGFADDYPGMVQLSDPDGELWKRFEIVEQSSFIILDANGDEVLRTGYADDDAVAGAVADLVG